MATPTSTGAPAPARAPGPDHGPDHGPDADSGPASRPEAPLAGRFRSNLLWAGVGEGGAKLLGLAANIAVARALKVEAYGLFTLAQSVALYLWVVAGLGTPVYGVREVSRDRGRAGALLGELFSLRVVAAGVAAGLGVAVASQMESGTRAAALAVGCGYLLALAPSPAWVLRGLERFRLLAIGHVVTAVTWLVAALVLVEGSHHAVRAIGLWVGAQALGAALLLALLARSTGLRVRPRVDPRAWANHLRHSSFYMVSAATRLGAQLVPLAFVDAWGTPEMLGIYAAAYRIVVLLAYGGGLVAQAGFPILSSLAGGARYHEFRQAVGRMERLVLVLGVLVAGGLGLLAVPAVRMLFGAEFTAAAEVLSWMAWYLPLFLLRSIYGPALQALGGHRRHAACSALGLLASLVVTPLLLGPWGARGAAVAWVLSEAAIVAAMKWVLVHVVPAGEGAP